MRQFVDPGTICDPSEITIWVNLASLDAPRPNRLPFLIEQEQGNSHDHTLRSWTGIPLRLWHLTRNGYNY